MERIERIAMDRAEKYNTSIAEAEMLMETGLEPTSALKQAASDNGIKEGTEMGSFVTWARKKWFGNEG